MARKRPAARSCPSARDLTEDRTREKNRAEKLLESAAIKLSSVVTDLHGVTGRDIMDHLIAGQRNPKALAQLARTRARRKITELELALEGAEFFAPEHAALLAKMPAASRWPGRRFRPSRSETPTTRPVMPSPAPCWPSSSTRPISACSATTAGVASRSGSRSGGGPDLGAQYLVQPGQRALIAPGGEVPVYRLYRRPGREAVRQVPPGAPGPVPGTRPPRSGVGCASFL